MNGGRLEIGELFLEVAKLWFFLKEMKKRVFFVKQFLKPYINNVIT
jgi:hypothetical protein